MDEIKSGFRRSLIMTAIGAIIKILGLIVFMFYVPVIMPYEAVYEACAFMGIIVLLGGTILTSIGLFSMGKWLKEVENPSTGAILAGCGSLLFDFFIAFLYLRLIKAGLDFPRMMFPDIAALMLVLYLAGMILLWIGTAKIMKVLPTIKLACVGYAILTFMPAMFMTYVIFDEGSGDFAGFIAVISLLLIIMALIFRPIGWFMGLISVNRMEAADEGFSVTDADHETPDCQPQPAKPKLTDQQLRQLYSFDDERLQRIVANPAVYDNPAYVNEAKSILAKRRAWETVEGRSELELMSIIHSDKYPYEVVDAASMELYQRRSRLLFDELLKQDRDSLMKIATSRGEFFDGYIFAARDILDNKIPQHPATPQQPPLPAAPQQPRPAAPQQPRPATPQQQQGQMPPRQAAPQQPRPFNPQSGAQQQ